MFLSPLLLVLLPLVLLAGGQSPYYEVPQPIIEALNPRGLRISIPDEPGVELFAVHANVNRPMRNLEAGQISTDITKATKGRWVFEDKRVRLKPGDVINYWLYVQADGLGYRKDDQTFTVKKLVDEDSPEGAHPQSGPATLPPHSPAEPPIPTGFPTSTKAPHSAPFATIDKQGQPLFDSSDEKNFQDYMPGGGPQMMPPLESCDFDIARLVREQSSQRHELLAQQAKELHELRMAHEHAEHRERMKLLRDGCKIDDDEPPELRVWRYRRDYWP